MRLLRELFERNRAWASEMTRSDPNFFNRLSEQQTPNYLWIGCSDSRVPANQIVGLLPGEMFVHRNIANLVMHTDMNCLSAMQFAIDILKIPHIIICGHYGCGGVLAALRNERLGLIDNWLRQVQNLYAHHSSTLEFIAEEQARHRRLCELNVIEQVVNASKTTIVQDAWFRGEKLAIHGWIYDLQDGLLRDLQVTVTSESEISPVADAARALLPNAG